MRFSAFLILITSFIIISCSEENTHKQARNDETSLFLDEVRAYYFTTLDSTIYYLNQMDTSNAIEKNQNLFLQVRKWYKYNEPMMMAYDYENYLTINGPNLLKVEIDDYTDIKKIEPKSLQVVEEIIFDESPDLQKLQSTLQFLKVRLPFIKKNHIIYRQRDKHQLKLIRDAIVNIAAKGLTGFDSPMLANSLNEAAYNYQSVNKIITIYEEAFQDKSLYDEWKSNLEKSVLILKKGEFDSFDRYSFLKNFTNKQLVLVNKTASDWGIELNTSRELNPKAENLFQKDFLNLEMYAYQDNAVGTTEQIKLGKILFNDASLSQNKNMSCASCHLANKAFTDGKPKALGIDGKELQRNTPTLTYAAFQKSFFYDGRSDGLENQIVSVVNAPDEFHMDLKEVEKVVKADSTYIKLFNAAYAGEISDQNIRNAIANYVRDLSSFNSKFDRNMQSIEQSLTASEIQGFNLFMGKAGCGTCHFAPTFNGTVPPKYNETEFENLGVPATASFTNPELDDDPGLFYPYEVEEKRHFFKTSTVRNVALTAPYMHNGVYESLEEVLQFYNVGGGAGMGLEVPYQTLPPDSLNLSEPEINAIIAFMNTLTDQQYQADSINTNPEYLSLN